MTGHTLNVMTLRGLALAIGIPGRRRDRRDREHEAAAVIDTFLDEVVPEARRLGRTLAPR